MIWWTERNDNVAIVLIFIKVQAILMHINVLELFSTFPLNLQTKFCQEDNELSSLIFSSYAAVLKNRWMYYQLLKVWYNWKVLISLSDDVYLCMTKVIGSLMASLCVSCNCWHFLITSFHILHQTMKVLI